MDDLIQEDKPGSLADALLGDSDKKEAHQLADKVEALHKAIQLRLPSLK